MRSGSIYSVRRFFRASGNGGLHREFTTMNSFAHATASFGKPLFKHTVVFALSFAVLFGTLPQPAKALQDAQQDTQAPPPSGQAPAPQYTPETPEQLQQLVAPIALY